METARLLPVKMCIRDSDYTMAQIVDGAGMDVILLGDSASNVMAGNVTTLPITLDQMIYHAKSVVRGVKRAMHADRSENSLPC